MKPVPITEGIHYVGVQNPDLRIFDVIMHTEYGTSYNAYVVKGRDKTAVVDMVKEAFGEEHLEAVSKLVDPADIDYIVFNHTEPDHAGSLKDFLKAAPKAVVVGTRAAIGFLREQTNMDFPSHITSEGDTLDLGGMTLRFIMAPFLHWPDSQFTWIEERGALLTGDMFGCHYSAPGVFDDTVDRDLIKAQKYYFDVIMGPFKNYVLDAIGKVRPLPVSFIAPSHGPVLRAGPWGSVDRFEQWAQDINTVNDPRKVIIAWVSAYGYTKMLARKAEEVVKAEGLDVRSMEITSMDPGELMALIDTSDGLLIGSPTFNRDALPPVWGLMTGLSAYRHKGKIAGAFGSYGWSGEAVGYIEGRLKALGLKVPVPGYRVRFRPSEAQLGEMEAFVRQFTAAVKAG